MKPLLFNRALHFFQQSTFSQRFVVLVFFATVLPGCGPENELGRLPYSGTVTLNGDPLKQGSISFVPNGKGEGAAIRSGTTITNGQFAVEGMKGLPPGEYLVKIHAASGTSAPPEEQAPGEFAPVQRELIPPEYNVRSEETVTIKEDGENSFTFAIQTGG